VGVGETGHRGLFGPSYAVVQFRSLSYRLNGCVYGNYVCARTHTHGQADFVECIGLCCALRGPLNTCNRAHLLLPFVCAQLGNNCGPSRQTR